MTDDPNAVLDFWFGDVVRAGVPDQPEAWGGYMTRWYRGGADLDNEIRERFGEAHARAAAGLLDGWADSPRSLLALVIALDQFSRNLHRDTPAAYAQDDKARALTRKALERGDDRELAWFERIFLTIPLGHSEVLADQDRGLTYLADVWAPLLPASLAPISALVRSKAQGNRDTIARFGRFPARNQALGRESTAEELASMQPR